MEQESTFATTHGVLSLGGGHVLREALHRPAGVDISPTEQRRQIRPVCEYIQEFIDPNVDLMPPKEKK